MKDIIRHTAMLLREADAIAIFAGAGMGVDSGLEQYRGTDGLWTQSITVNGQEIHFYDLMKPAAFRKQPGLAWGLTGFLLEKYRTTNPHAGFGILKDMLYLKEYFIITSNTDQQFQKAGFSPKRIFEFHGSIFRTQCGEKRECGTWETPYITFDPETMTARPPFPECPFCQAYCRPNVYLFDDEDFVTEISAEQQFRYMEWRETVESRFSRLVALEIGAGKTIPTIRRYAERFAGDAYPLIRVNPEDCETDSSNHVPIQMGAADFFRHIQQELYG